MSSSSLPSSCASLLDYCETMSMSYSYKPVLLLALCAQPDGQITLDQATAFFVGFYAQRLEKGLIAEKRDSLFSHLRAEPKLLRGVIRQQPIHAFLNTASAFFAYERRTETFSMKATLWTALTPSAKQALRARCYQRLDRYYASLDATQTYSLLPFHRPQDDYGYFSNDYASPFTVAHTAYESMTQYMAHRRALLSGDERLGRMILRHPDALPSSVWTPEDIAWRGQRQVIAYKGLYAKFSQNPDLTDALLDTGSLTLAACLPEDTVWGTGLSLTDPNLHILSDWRGANLLGYTLMQVRSELISQQPTPCPL